MLTRPTLPTPSNLLQGLQHHFVFTPGYGGASRVSPARFGGPFWVSSGSNAPFASPRRDPIEPPVSPGDSKAPPMSPLRDPTASPVYLGIQLCLLCVFLAIQWRLPCLLHGIRRRFLCPLFGVRRCLPYFLFAFLWCRLLLQLQLMYVDLLRPSFTTISSSPSFTSMSLSPTTLLSVLSGQSIHFPACHFVFTCMRASQRPHWPVVAIPIA